MKKSYQFFFLFMPFLPVLSYFNVFNSFPKQLSINSINKNPMTMLVLWIQVRPPHCTFRLYKRSLVTFQILFHYVRRKILLSGKRKKKRRKEILLLTRHRHTITLRDFNAWHVTRTQLYEGDFSARKKAWMYCKRAVGWIDSGAGGGAVKLTEPQAQLAASPILMVLIYLTTFQPLSQSRHFHFWIERGIRHCLTKLTSVFIVNNSKICPKWIIKRKNQTFKTEWWQLSSLSK